MTAIPDFLEWSDSDLSSFSVPCFEEEEVQDLGPFPSKGIMGLFDVDTSWWDGRFLRGCKGELDILLFYVPGFQGQPLKPVFGLQMR